MIKTTLYPHQFDSVLRFHMGMPKTGDWSDCGTGKSLIALAKFNALYEAGVVKNLLIVCPLSVISSWRDEIQNHTSLKFMALTGSIDQRLAKLKEEGNIYAITYDSIAGRGISFPVMYEALYSKFKKDNMIVCDEATMIKSIEAKRTRALIALCDSINFSIFLSGTFMPQNIVDVFTIYRAMDGGETFGENIYRARSHFMENINEGGKFPKWELKEEKEDEFKSKLFERAIRLKKEDCTSLPPKVHMFRYCQFEPNQLMHYNHIRKELYTELEGEKITVQNVLSKLTKLQQIIGGFIYNKEGVAKQVGTAKYKLLGDVLGQINPEEKVVIYARFREELYNIQSLLTLYGYNSAMLHGTLSEADRATNIKRFREDPNVKALVAQISTGGYGLTVVEANHIVYFSMTFSLIDYLQSQDRIHRIGQTKTCMYHYLLTEDENKRTIDQYIFDSLKRNLDITLNLANPSEKEELKQLL